MLKTAFWRRAARSFPPEVRQRYAPELERAESIDLALDAAIEAWLRIKAALAWNSGRRLR